MSLLRFGLECSSRSELKRAGRLLKLYFFSDHLFEGAATMDAVSVVAYQDFARCTSERLNNHLDFSCGGHVLLKCRADSICHLLAEFRGTQAEIAADGEEIVSAGMG